MKTFATTSKPEPRRPVPCALCGGESFRPLWDLGDFSYVACRRCGLVQQNPQPEPDFVLGRYDDSYRDYEVERQNDYAALERMALRDLGFDVLDGKLRERASLGGGSPRFLDVGCATGALMSGLKGEGWECVGVEPCEPAARYGRERYGLDIRATVLEKADLEPGSFDIVHASHVIEHLNDPRTLLHEARRLLIPSGRLILTTPNLDGFQARVLGGAWRSAIFDHLYLFSARSLRAMLEETGFRVERMVTWGGWARGLRPAFIKPALDSLVKPLGLGDVMAFLCSVDTRKDRGAGR